MRQNQRCLPALFGDKKPIAVPKMYVFDYEVILL